MGEPSLLRYKAKSELMEGFPEEDIFSSKIIQNNFQLNIWLLNWLILFCPMVLTQDNKFQVFIIYLKWV